MAKSSSYKQGCKIVSFSGTMEYTSDNGVYTFEWKSILSTGNTLEWDLEVYSCERKNLDQGSMLRRLSPDFVIVVSYTGKEKKKPVGREFNFTFKDNNKEIIRSEKEIKTDFGVTETRLSKFYKKSEFPYSQFNFEVDVRRFRMSTKQDSIPIADGVNRVQQKVLDLLNSKMFCDFIISVEGTDIPVHRCILVSSSPAFEAMLRMPGAETGRVQIHNLKLNTARTMVNFMYAGIVDHPTVTLALDLLSASDLYVVNDLQVWCFQYLEQHLGMNNILEILLFAHDYNIPKLKEKCLSFLIANKHRVDLSSKLKKGLKQRGDLAMEILGKVWK